MNCSRELIEAYVDEELDASLKAAVEEHLGQCQNCSVACLRLREQQAGIRSLPRYQAPERLRQAVTRNLRRTAPAVDMRWRWLAIAASVLLAISLFWNVSRFRPGATENDLLAQSLVDGHIRSLMGAHLLDVPSTDQHTVKPWFDGKLDFAPNVKDFAAEGFPLIGGRVDYLSHKPVAALIYRRRQHVINLFTWPAAGSHAAEKPAGRSGYNLVHWDDGSMTYWAVSDVAIGDLEQFQKLYQR